MAAVRDQKFEAVGGDVYHQWGMVSAESLIELAACDQREELAVALASLSWSARKTGEHRVLCWLRHGGLPISSAQTPPAASRLETFRYLIGSGVYSRYLLDDLVAREKESDLEFIEALASSPEFDGILRYYDLRAGSEVEGPYSEILARQAHGRALVADADRLIAEMEASGPTRKCIAGTSDADVFITECWGPVRWGWVSPAQRAVQLGAPALAAEMLALASPVYRGGVSNRIAQDVMQKVFSELPELPAPYLDLFAQVVEYLDEPDLAWLLEKCIRDSPNEPSRLLEVLAAAPKFGGLVCRTVRTTTGMRGEYVPYREYIEHLGKARLLETLWSEPRAAWCGAVAAGIQRRVAAPKGC